MKKILLFDNYDSFTYNLKHLLAECGADADVRRNDKIGLDEIEAYDKILLSPGPGIPSEAGILLPLIKTYAPYKSILGVCLGHQAIAEAFGGTLENLPEVYHGIQSAIRITDKDEILFSGLPKTLKVGRYHSWAVSAKWLPACLRITATDDDGMIMALRHEQFDVRGVQFHPESVLTENGQQIIANWLAE